MAFRFSLTHVAARAGGSKVSFPMFPSLTSAFSRIPITPSPSLTGSQYVQNFERAKVTNLFELCAVPKKRTSPRRKLVRAQGRWERNANTLYRPYKMCLECRRALLPGQICTVNKNCTSMPRFF